MKIEIKIKDVWGDTKYYPENESARIFAELLGQKTLTAQNLWTIKKLGYEIVSIARTSDDLLADLITN